MVRAPARECAQGALWSGRKKVAAHKAAGACQYQFTHDGPWVPSSYPCLPHSAAQGYVAPKCNARR